MAVGLCVGVDKQTHSTSSFWGNNFGAEMLRYLILSNRERPYSHKHNQHIYCAGFVLVVAVDGDVTSGYNAYLKVRTLADPTFMTIVGPGRGGHRTPGATSEPGGDIMNLSLCIPWR